VTLKEIGELLNAEVLTKGANLNIEIKCVNASDLMSDVLASAEPGELLLTGLTNTQVIRTCEIAGIQAIVFVRNKKPTDETVRLSENCQIPILGTNLTMFDACGILFSKGIRSVI